MSNSENNLFEKASRLKLRFSSPAGLLTVEDLWDLPLSAQAKVANLDDIAKGLNKTLEQMIAHLLIKRRQRIQLRSWPLILFCTSSRFDLMNPI
jgi:hypothetical protein